MKRFSSHSGFTYVFFVIVVLFMSACGGGGGGGGGVVSLPVSGEYVAKTDTISRSNLIAKHNGVMITFPSYDINGSYTLKTVQLNPKKLDFAEDEGIDSDYEIKMYDFNLAGKKKFEDFIKITIPYDKNTSGSVIAMYYNPDTKSFESVDYIIDEKNSEVNISTNHLSSYASARVKNSIRHGTFTVKNDNTRLAKIINVWGYPKYVESYVASSVLNEAMNNNMQPTDNAYEAGLDRANFWLGISASTNTLVSAGYPSSYLETLGNSFNAVGLLASVVQAGVDFQSGNTQALYTNLLKNGTYTSVSYFGVSALQLAFVGVFAIDLSLNYTMSVVLNDNEEKWKKVYDKCYAKFYKKTPTEWYHALRKVTREADIKSTEEMQKRIEKAIDDNVNDLWDNALNMVDCKDSLKGSASVRDKISQAKKVELVNALEPVFMRLAVAINKSNKFNYISKLEDLKNHLNKTVKVSISENVKAGESAKCAGYKLRFSPLSSVSNKSTWSGTLRKDGSTHTKFTILGHMQAGYPNKIDIYKPDADLDKDKPIKSIEFKMTMPQINISIDGNDCSILRPPLASPESEEFEDKVEVTLTSEDTDYIIYRINGGDLTLYKNPIVLTDSATIRAYADSDPYDKDAQRSDIAIFKYVKVDNNSSKGRWILSKTSTYIYAKLNEDDKCREVSMNLSAGSSSLNKSISKGSCNYDLSASETFTGSWTNPPSEMIPGKKYKMDASLSRSTLIDSAAEWYPITNLAADIDQYDLGCSFVTGSNIEIGKSLHITGYKTDIAKDEFSDIFTAPSYGFADSETSNKIQVRVSVDYGNGCVNYIYEWKK